MPSAARRVTIAALHVIGDRRQTLAGPVTLQVKFATKFGLPAQHEQIVTLRLNPGRVTRPGAC